MELANGFTHVKTFFVIKIVGNADLSLCTDHLCCFMLYFVHTSDGDIGQAQRCLPSERTQDMVAKSIQATITYPIEFFVTELNDVFVEWKDIFTEM